MAQAVQRSAMPSEQVRRSQKQARVWADGLVELHQRLSPRFDQEAALVAVGQPWDHALVAVDVVGKPCSSTGSPSAGPAW